MSLTREALKKKKIGVLLGGLSAEREVSLKTGAAILDSLKRQHFPVVGIDVGRDICRQLQAENIEVAFLALHGRYGEDGAIQGVLEFLQIPYTGPGVLASSVAMNKLATKRFLESAGIPIPLYLVAVDKTVIFATEQKLGYPLVVKPTSEGSSLGISIVNAEAGLQSAQKKAFNYDAEILLEQYIPGREITAAVLEGEPLPLIEIQPVSGFYDFKAKYTPGATNYLVPAPLPDRLTQVIQQLAVQSCMVIGCRSGAIRVDFRLDPDDKPFVIELNTIPGMTGTSLLPKAAQTAGIDFDS
ncbi:MAG: D-alanine--D-alanine ligase, partial [Deltaproteobacteria bacterium]|nr:D-alanine--D-alanine ligase [Candidatus Tharpellaceae bacterium]